MDTFLRRLKLLQDFSMTIPMNGHEFVQKLSDLTVPRTSLLEVLGSSGKLFVGEVNLTELNIRPKKTFGQNNLVHATRLMAQVNSKPNSVTITGDIRLSKFYPIMMFSFLFLYFAFASFIIVRENPVTAIFLFVQLCFVLGIFYFVYRRSIKQAKVFFERELFFLTNKNQ